MQVPDGSGYAPSRNDTLVGVGHPWHSLTELLLTPGEVAEGRLREAWEETAGRLGLIRLGWIPGGGPGDHDDEVLVHPTLRAIARWRHAAAPGGAAGSGRAAEELAVIDAPGGRLIAGACRGGLPNRRSLDEVAALAAALHARRRDRAALELAQARARGARRALAAAHDLRNELTRALLFEARSRHDGSTVDRAASEARDELERALYAARELAQEALRGDHGALLARPLEPLPLRAILEQECRAATEAARTEPGAAPRLRLRAPAHLKVLGRPGSFERAIRNLVTNALEAAAKRRGAEGTVSVWAETLTKEPEGPDEARRLAAGFNWTLAVEDDGAGMDPERLRRFLDAPPAANRAQDSSAHPASTGLGTASLAVALEDSGLPIQVRSRRGAGTRIDVGLRQAPAAPVHLIVDRDLRRGPRRQREVGGASAAWWIANEDAAALLGNAAASLGETATGAPPLSAS